MDERRPDNPREPANESPTPLSGSVPRRRLLLALVALAAVAETDVAAARRRSRRRRRGGSRKCHGGLARWFATIAEGAPSGDGVGGEASADASGGSIVYGDIGPNADVRLSASGGQRTVDASGGDGHIDIPPDAEGAVEACKDRRRRQRRRKRQRRR